jgi:hypothetical protein
MEKQNLRGEELALARTLAREFATKYNRRRGVVPPDVPQEVLDALRHRFGHAADYALDEYRARFACYYESMTPDQWLAAHKLGFQAAMRAPIGAPALADYDAICTADRQALAALDGGHINWPIWDEYLAMYNETIMETER